MSALKLTLEQLAAPLTSQNITEIIKLGLDEATEVALPEMLALMNLDAASISAEEIKTARTITHAYFRNLLDFLTSSQFEDMIVRVKRKHPEAPILSFYEDVLDVQSMIFTFDHEKGEFAAATEDETIAALASSLDFYWTEEREEQLALLETDEENERMVGQRTTFLNGLKLGNSKMSLIKAGPKQYGRSAKDMWALIDAIVGVVVRTSEQGGQKDE